MTHVSSLYSASITIYNCLTVHFCHPVYRCSRLTPRSQHPQCSPAVTAGPDVHAVCSRNSHHRKDIHATIFNRITAMYPTALCCTAPRRLALHRIALRCTALPRTVPHRLPLHCIAMHCTASPRTAPHRPAQHRIALHRDALPCTALHHLALHRIASHCTASHCTALRWTSPSCIIPRGHALHSIDFN
jgi:hypothetical protein